MAISVYLVRRSLRSKRRNGRARSTLTLRWKDPATQKWQCENTRTGDMTEARQLQRLKWAELNKVVPAEEDPKPAQTIKKPSWQECRDAAERAMTADNLRPLSIADSLGLFDALYRMFPGLASPADLTPGLVNEYKRVRAVGDPKRDMAPVSPWTILGDLSALKALFGNWLVRE